MKLLVALLFSMPLLATATPCDELFELELARSQAMDKLDYINDLADRLDSLRKSNGRLNRNSKIMRDRRYSLLKTKLEQGEHAQIAAVYAPVFEKVELAVFTIINHSPYFEQDPTRLSSTNDDLTYDQLTKMFNELNQAYKNLGENYIDYKMARTYLEGVAKNGRGLKWSAGRVLERMSLKKTARRLPGLGITQDNYRPSMTQVEDAFVKNIEPLVALLKHDLKEEQIKWYVKYGLTGLQALERALMKIGQFQVAGVQVGGPGFQKFLTTLVGISRDDYLKREYLHRVEEIVNQRKVKYRAQNLLEACNRQCDELLETFARVGSFTDDWHILKQHISKQAERKNGQYSRVLAMMETAEEKAQKLNGLSLNYEDIQDQYGRRFLVSSSARGLFALMATTTYDTWSTWFQNLANLI